MKSDLSRSAIAASQSLVTSRVLLLVVLGTSLFGTVCYADRAIDRAEDLLEARQFQAAAAAFEKIAGRTEENSSARAEAYMQWGVSLLRLKKFEPAIERFETALACRSISSETRSKVLVEKGYCLRRLDRPEEAVQCFLPVIDDPTAAPLTRSTAALYCASTYVKLNKSDLSLQQLRFVTQQAETNPHYRATAWLGIGRAYAKSGDFTAARSAFEAALKEGETGTRSAAARTELAEVELLGKPDTPLFMLPWATRVAANHATLHWVAKGDVPAAEVTVSEGETQFATHRLDELRPGFFLYASQISGLTPGSTFHYRVSGGGVVVNGSFVTPSNDEKQSLTFCVMGDTQSRARVHAQVAKHLAAQQPEFVLHAGDCVESGVDWLQWQTQVFGPGRPYLKKAPLYPARGNHDGGSYFPRLFGLTDRLYYSFDHGPVHVAAIDAFGPDSSGEPRKRQVEWLDRDLAASSAPWKVVFVHDPMVNEDLRNDWFGLEDFTPVIEKHKVAVVFSGHHHRYRRFLPLHPPGRPEAGGTWHITTGGSGGTLSGRGASPIISQSAQVHHFLRVDVNPQQMRITALDLQGNLVDAFVLDRDPQGVVRGEDEAPVDRAVAERIVSFYTHLSPFKRPDELVARQSDGEVVIDFASLPQGPMDTSDFPAEMRVEVAVAERCDWKVKPQTFSLRGAKELRFQAKAPQDPPTRLRLTLRTWLGTQELKPQTFQVVAPR